MAGLQASRRALALSRLCRSSSPLILSRKSSSAPEDFFKRNDALKRPMSPHVTVYKPQWTWVLSIFHRGTGVWLSFGVYAGAAATYMTAGNLDASLAAMSLPPLVGLLGKTSLSFPFVYHSLNGVRHLNWDRGEGFEIKTLEKQGVAVLASSLLVSALMALLL